jgi:hypothetical protein
MCIVDADPAVPGFTRLRYALGHAPKIRIFSINVDMLGASRVRCYPVSAP